MDYQSITAAVTSLRLAGDIAKGLIHLNTMTEVQSKAIELNDRIIEAQHKIFEVNAAQSVLIEKVRELETQVARMRDWDTQKLRYRLAAPFPNCMVYALKKDMSEGQPAHYLCASCFQKGEASILQGREVRQSKEGRSNASYLCPNCRSEAVTSWFNVPAPQYCEDIQPQS